MSTKVLIIVIAAVVLVMGMMGAGFFLMWSKMSAAVAQVQAVQAPAEQPQEEVPLEEQFGPMYKLDTLIVNLADKGGKRYLRVTMEMEVSSQEAVAEIEKRLPVIRDAILMILPSKTYAQIATTDGKVALRDEIMGRINELLKTGKVKNLYFTEFVVQ